MFEINPYYQLLNATNTVHSNRILGYVLGMDTTIIFCSLIAKSYYYKERDMLDDGWFYCTVLDLEESTTYGKKTQDRAIKRLIDEGLIEYKRAGLPAKRYFRLTNDFNSLCRVIQEGEKKGLEIREKRRKSENAEKPDNMRNSDNTSKNGQPANGYNSSSSNLDYLDSPIGTNLMNQNGLTGSTNLDEHTYNHNKINHKDNKSKNQASPDEREDNNNSENISLIVGHLNEKAGTKYTAKGKETVKHITARLNEGFTVEDFYTVIDRKCLEWRGTDYEKYLRPSTLFSAAHFEEYLNAPVKEEKKDDFDVSKYEALINMF